MHPPLLERAPLRRAFRSVRTRSSAVATSELSSMASSTPTAASALAVTCVCFWSCMVLALAWLPSASKQLQPAGLLQRRPLKGCQLAPHRCCPGTCLTLLALFCAVHQLRCGEEGAGQTSQGPETLKVQWGERTQPASPFQAAMWPPC